MTLEAYLNGLRAVRIAAPSGADVGTLCADSRAVKPGDTFVAVEGLTVDGHDFIDRALQNGAPLIFSQKPLPDNVPHVQFDNVPIADLAAQYYGHPARKLTVTGVTGTNGKTTVTHILHGVLNRAGIRAGLIGTNTSARTTPDALELQALLADMVKDGKTHCVMEVSSHALELGRVGNLRFKAAAFTNLTRDHLDFHKDMEGYYAAKRKLFDIADAAVVNISDPYGARLSSEIACVTFSAHQNAELSAKDVELLPGSVKFTAVYGGQQARVTWAAPGRFSVGNALAAIGCGLALGLGLDEQANLISQEPPVKGRMETVPYPGGFTVLIDYAHTPDALKNALTAVRGFTEGKLITVFGCGGDRDREKRPLMGAVATELSDYAIVTSDNPRNEQPDDIINDIISGCKGQLHYTVEPDRRRAIGMAVDRAKPGDAVLLCGKGHETYQEIAGVKYPMDEREIVKEFAGRG